MEIENKINRKCYWISYCHRAEYKEIENKTPDITNLATKAALNTKAAKVESKIPQITNLPTKAALNTKATKIKNKTPYTTGFITPE